jgi:hypothetical protein
MGILPQRSFFSRFFSPIKNPWKKRGIDEASLRFCLRELFEKYFQVE